MTEDRVQTLHPEAGKSGPRIERWKYEAVAKAILRAVPRRGAGLPFGELAGQVRELLPANKLAELGSVSWYTTTIKLDLEARGVLQRVPGARPQRLLRA